MAHLTGPQTLFFIGVSGVIAVMLVFLAKQMIGAYQDAIAFKASEVAIEEAATPLDEATRALRERVEELVVTAQLCDAQDVPLVAERLRAEQLRLQEFLREIAIHRHREMSIAALTYLPVFA